MYKEIVEKAMEEVSEFLINDMEHQSKQICYVLVNNKNYETNTLASDNEEAIEFTPYSKDSPSGFDYVQEWDFNFDYYVFNLLENDYDIGYMNNETHYGIWCSINELYPTDINYGEGVQKYLKYCKDNGITKEFLESKLNVNVEDIMKYYKEQVKDKVILQKGFRKDQPVALIELNRKDNKEYVIAFYYDVKDKKIDWGYGYYYNNYEKAKKDFDKVLNKGDLSNTFENKIKNKER